MNHTTHDLSDVLVAIDCKLKSLEAMGQDYYPRTVKWAIAALELAGWSRSQITRAIKGKEPKQQWPILRARLSPAALNTLKGILEVVEQPTGRQLEIGAGTTEPQEK